MAFTQMLDANPELAQEWAREMLCAGMVKKTLPDQDSSDQSKVANMLNKKAPNLDSIRTGYLKVHNKNQALLIWSTHALSTSSGQRMHEIAETLTLECAGIYVDEQNTSVFLCTHEDASMILG